MAASSSASTEQEEENYFSDEEFDSLLSYLDQETILEESLTEVQTEVK